MATKVDMRFIDSPADLEALANIDTDTLNALLANADILTYHNAGTHNSLYRGKDLGSKLTDEQSAAIRAGTFEGVYVGDSWTFENVPYSYVDANNATQAATYSGTMRVADCDYFLNTGETSLTTHHVVVVPDTSMFRTNMNSKNTTEGGYANSKMCTTYLRRAEAIFKACFGEEHVLLHQEFLSNAVTNGVQSGLGWYDRLCDLMSPSMVCDVSPNEGTSLVCKQLNLFRHKPYSISIRSWYWLRGIINDTYFNVIGEPGYLGGSNAIQNMGVRPYALIY